MPAKKILVGVLALQGNVAEHFIVLKKLQVRSKEIRTIDDMNDVSHLIIPGGESTVMARFLQISGLDEYIQKKAGTGKLAVFGTCAGAILLATNVTGKNAPKPLELIDMTVDRNAYGSQLDSFEMKVKVRGIKRPVEVCFIRAPIITEVGKSVEVLAKEGRKPILVRQGRHLAATFHEEMRGETAVHEMFLHL